MFIDDTIVTGNISLTMTTPPSAPDMDSMMAPPPAYNEIIRTARYSIGSSEELGRRRSQKKARKKVARTKIIGAAVLIFALILGFV